MQPRRANTKPGVLHTLPGPVPGICILKGLQQKPFVAGRDPAPDISDRIEKGILDIQVPDRVLDQLSRSLAIRCRLSM
jgi:hypothetical protein